MIRKALTFSAAVMALVGLLNGQAYLDNRYYQVNSHAADFTLPSGRFLRAFAMGYNEAVADLIWLRTVVYYSGEFYGRVDYRHLDRYLDTVIAIDPHFRAIYKWGAVLPIYNRRAITERAVQRAIHYAELGAKAFPNDWEFPFRVGSLYSVEMYSAVPARAQEWRAKGAPWIQRAALLPGGPPWLPLLAANLYTRAGESELAIRHLEEVYLATDDPETKLQLGFRLRDLRKEQAKAIFQERDRFEQRWRARFPYVPSDFFVLLGDRLKPTTVLRKLMFDDDPAEPPE